MLIAQDAGRSGVSSLLFLLVLVVGMYLLLIRPQRVRARQLAQVRSSLQVGTRVITTAGLHGTVVQIDDDTVLLEIAPGVSARFLSQAVVRVIEEPAPAEAEPDEPA